MGKEVLGIIFFISWMICGCSAEQFFDGGAPVAILAALVALACAHVLGGRHDSDH